LNTGTHFGRRKQKQGTTLRTRRLRLEALETRNLLAPLADIVDVTPDPRDTPVGLVVINFSEEVTGVDASDFSLTRDGADVPLTFAPVTGSGATWAIDLASFTIDGGAYILRLEAAGSGIVGSSLEPLESDAFDSWTIDVGGPTADIVDISPDPRTTFVGNVAINFSEAVTGVDINDFTLTRDGAAVNLGGLTVSGSGSAYSLNLSSVTSTDGTYVLTLVASGSDIEDSLGNAFTADASDTWTLNATPPTADIVDVSPDPRNASVSSVAVTFNRAVTGVDVADFTLTRNGTNVALTGVTVSGTGSNYTLNNLTTATTAAGTYVLTLVASTSGITDSNGLALAANASDTWVNDVAAPTADIVDVTPDPRTSAVGLVTINFSETVTGVSVSDFRLTRNGTVVSLAGVPLAGSGASYTLDLSSVTNSVGSYVLTLIASGSGITDLSGNALVANASDSFSIDDAAEDNDTLRTAYELGRLSGSTSYGPLSLIDGNDWFRFTTSAKGTAADSVSISFNNAAGNLDLELYNVSGQKLKGSTGNGNTETISLANRPIGTYYIRVFGKAGAINPEYTLTVNAPIAPVEDGFEQNDTRTTAANLGTFVSASTITDLALLDSHDWFRFTTTGTGTSADSVRIQFANVRGNLNLELYNAAGKKIGTSSGSGNSEQISLAGRAAGTYFVHVLGKSGAKNADYSLTIDPPSVADFNIQFQFDGMTASQVATFQQAANRWQNIITGDLPGASVVPEGASSSVVVDDVFIDVAAFDFDGVGTIIGGSAPLEFRAGSGLPFYGVILFDRADLPTAQAEGTLLGSVVHEIAHVLGFGSIWEAKGLLAGGGTDDPTFTGAQALAAYNDIFDETATGVPVDNSGLSGTADSHWRESIFGSELMTGFIGPDNVNPLSVISIASLADLGYSVDLNEADPYEKPEDSLFLTLQAPAGNGKPAGLAASSAALDALMARWLTIKSDVKKWVAIG
jgi:hypothetical protein